MPQGIILNVVNNINFSFSFTFCDLLTQNYITMYFHLETLNVINLNLRQKCLSISTWEIKLLFPVRRDLAVQAALLNSWPNRSII